QEARGHHGAPQEAAGSGGGVIGHSCLLWFPGRVVTESRPLGARRGACGGGEGGIAERHGGRKFEFRGPRVSGGCGPSSAQPHGTPRSWPAAASGPVARPGAANGRAGRGLRQGAPVLPGNLTFVTIIPAQKSGGASQPQREGSDRNRCTLVEV